MKYVKVVFIFTFFDKVTTENKPLFDAIREFADDQK